MDPSVYAVTTFDTTKIIINALKETGGDTSDAWTYVATRPVGVQGPVPRNGVFFKVSSMHAGAGT